MNHDEWLDRWFDGDLSTAELAGFEAELRKDDLLRRSLVERSLLEANLIDALAGTARARKRHRRPVHRTTSWAPFAAAAALLLGAAIFIATRPKPPDPVIVRQPRVEREARETELQVIKEREAVVVKQKPPDDDAALKAWEAEIAKIKAERAAKEREIELARVKDREVVTPQLPPPPPTLAAIARVTAAEDDSLVGHDVLPGDRFEGALSVAFPDGARIETLRGTELRIETGRVDLAHGSLSVSGKLAVTTPHGELAIDGASRVAVNGSTQIEVASGTARLKRLRDGRSIQIKPGFSADSADLAVKPSPKEETIVRFDFEKKSAGLLEGVVAKGVLSGVEKRERGTLRRQIAIENKEGLFTVADGMALRFDCWMKGGAGSLSVYLWDATQGANVFIVLSGVRESGWTKLSVKLDDLRVEGDSARKAKAGDVIGNVLISLFDEAPAALQIDNLEVVRRK